MSEQTLLCPKCQYEYPYESAGWWVCPQCNHEWREGDKNEEEILTKEEKICDANGTVLQDGDNVAIVKDLKVKGASSSLKIGTKVKNIKLVESADGHNISCRIDGFGAMALKSEFVKKI